MWILAIYSPPMVQYYTKEGGSKKNYWILMRCLQTSSMNFKVGFYWPNWTELILEVGGQNKIFFISLNKRKMIIKEREVVNVGGFN